MNAKCHIPAVFVLLLILSLSSCGPEAEDAPPRPADLGPPPPLPASGDDAQAALNASPRHGEWVDINAPGLDVPLHTWVVYPERSEPAPVVIVIHEIYGLTDWIRAVADQLAAEGYIAVAPDMLSGRGPGGGGTAAFAGEGVREAIGRLSVADVTERLNAARQYALDLPAAGNTSGVLGYCWGGSMSFAYATQQPALDAAVVFYGTAPTDPAELGQINCPVLGLYGGDDARVTSTVPRTTEQMIELSKEYASHVFDGAGHGFLRQQSGRDGANQRAAEQAWAMTLEFLQGRLGE